MSSERTSLSTTARENLSNLNKNVLLPLRRRVDTSLNPHVRGMALAGGAFLVASFIPEFAVARSVFRVAAVALEGTAIAQTANHRSLRRLSQTSSR